MTKIDGWPRKSRWKSKLLINWVRRTFNLVYPKYDKKICYYQEFWKVYLINEIMISKIKEYSVSNKSLTTQIEELEVTSFLILGSAEIVVANLGAEDQEKSKENFGHDLKIIRMPFS